MCQKEENTVKSEKELYKNRRNLSSDTIHERDPIQNIQ